MNILILEDSEDRWRQFQEVLAEHNLHRLVTARVMIEELGRHEWDALFLDHDLGGQTLAPSDENSGYAVALWLEQHPDRMPPITVVHSMNPVGGSRIEKALRATQSTDGKRRFVCRLPAAWSRPNDLRYIGL